MAVRYIGSKARIADAILDIVGDPTSKDGHFIDGFCGTGIVSKTAALRGWSIVGNDTLLSSTLLAEAALYSRSELNFSSLTSYENATELLNGCEPVEGYMWRTYSPASRNYCEYERRYFTAENAARIDGVRQKIAALRATERIGESEEKLLVADLIEAANHVANIAGTYGCFMRKWTQQSQGVLTLQPRKLLHSPVHHLMAVGDIFDLHSEPNDVVYLDPPYTKRQYASYYHIPETIAYNDNPAVSGVAGLRPWRHIASPFCYKTKALDALHDCIYGLSARRVFLSYSSQGHVRLEDLLSSLSTMGDVHIHELGEIGRYRPNRTAAEAGSYVREYLIEIHKA